MSVEQEIIKNYNDRDIGEIYNSQYSKFCGDEVKSCFVNNAKKFVQNIQNATILEIGAGQGNNIPFFIEAGFKTENIYLNELLPERVEALLLKVNAENVFPGNAITLNFQNKFNCIFQSTVFTSILNNADRINLAEKMWSLLNENGVIFWYDFAYNNPKNKNVKKVTRKNIKELFPNAKKITFTKITLAPPIGRKVGKLYNLLNWPILRTHLFAVIEK
ncbi:MAG: class I SAM-dependent methyltransferase [Bacteroidetes bacterium]|nr:class I SAM-dependent methyltransferase [Bacteroidota bacterium]